jgi:uncharacterized membrane protein (UPF0127 family)
MFQRFRPAALAALFVVFGATGCANAEPKKPSALPVETVTVISKTGAHTFKAEIADDEAERQKGLMFRESMADTQGMLFEFPDVAERSFWMRNTYIPLDIIYIGPDGRIVSIAREARPFDETPLPSYAPATGVLEINGGLASRLGIEPGDRVEHPFFKKR